MIACSTLGDVCTEGEGIMVQTADPELLVFSCCQSLRKLVTRMQHQT